MFKLYRQWDYAIILSGKDYPINRISVIEDTLRALRGPEELRANFDYMVPYLPAFLLCVFVPIILHSNAILNDGF